MLSVIKKIFRRKSSTTTSTSRGGHQQLHPVQPAAKRKERGCGAAQDRRGRDESGAREPLRAGDGDSGSGCRGSGNASARSGTGTNSTSTSSSSSTSRSSSSSTSSSTITSNDSEVSGSSETGNGNAASAPVPEAAAVAACGDGKSSRPAAEPLSPPPPPTFENEEEDAEEEEEYYTEEDESRVAFIAEARRPTPHPQHKQQQQHQPPPPQSPPIGHTSSRHPAAARTEVGQLLAMAGQQHQQRDSVRGNLEELRVAESVNYRPVVYKYSFRVADNPANMRVFTDPDDRRIEAIARSCDSQIHLEKLTATTAARGPSSIKLRRVTVQSPDLHSLQKCCRQFDDRFPHFYASSGLGLSNKSIQRVYIDELDQT